MQNNRSITEDTMFNVKNYPNAEGKNYGRHPANLHYIECGYGMPEIYNALSLIPNGGLQEEYKGVNPNSYRGSFAPTPRGVLWRRASATLRPKSAFICVQMNLDHNSTLFMWW